MIFNLKNFRGVGRFGATQPLTRPSNSGPTQPLSRAALENAPTAGLNLVAPFCPRCGQKHRIAGASFCSSCGRASKKLA